MPEDGVFCRPLCAGLDSEPSVVARRLGKLLDALDTEITVHVAEGALIEMAFKLKREMIERLRGEGWLIEFDADRSRWKVKAAR